VLNNRANDQLIVKRKGFSFKRDCRIVKEVEHNLGLPSPATKEKMAVV